MNNSIQEHRQDVQDFEHRICVRVRKFVAMVGRGGTR